MVSTSLPKVKEDTPVLPLNQSAPTSQFLALYDTLDNAVQLAKADSPTDVAFAGIVIDDKLAQPLKALLPIVVTLLGTLTEDKLAHCWKEASPICSNVAGKLIDDRFEQFSKADSPNERNELPISAIFKPLQPSNAWLPIEVTVFGTAIDCRLANP